VKYSLRSLLIVVTLTCVLLGGRIEYLRRRATYHEGETARHAERVENSGGRLSFMLQVHNTHDSGGSEVGCFVNEDHRLYVHHQNLAADYRRAAFRPWTVVKEPHVENFP
jgi:hypothetical protein